MDRTSLPNVPDAVWRAGSGLSVITHNPVVLAIVVAIAVTGVLCIVELGRAKDPTIGKPPRWGSSEEWFEGIDKLHVQRLGLKRIARRYDEMMAKLSKMLSRAVISCCLESGNGMIKLSSI